MSKVLFVVTHDTYVRNYFRTSALQDLTKNHEVVVLADSRLALRDEVEAIEGFVGFFEPDIGLENLHNFYFNLLMWRHRKKSKTFLYRWMRNSNWQLIKRNGSWIGRAASFLRWFVAACLNPRGLRIPLLANSVSFPLVEKIIRMKLRTNRSIEQFVVREKPDLILFPSTAFDPSAVDLITVGRSEGAKTLCLIDNWDNLSSKTIFWKKPDHLAVWGPQARIDAQAIHGFNNESVHLIGTPRFEVYFAQEIEKPQSFTFSHPYGLYVGSAMPFDDIGTLRALDEIISSSPVFPAKFKIVYRPHPWQQKRNTPSTFVASSFDRVLLDPQFEDKSGKGESSGVNNQSFQPDLDYYPGLLRSASIVIGPLTTMLFEASLCLRPVVALSYFDGYHANTAKRYFSHFEGMQAVPGFEFCEGREDLRSAIERGIRSQPIDRLASNRETSRFLYQDDLSYSQRLLALVDVVLSKD